MKHRSEGYGNHIVSVSKIVDSIVIVEVVNYVDLYNRTESIEKWSTVQWKPFKYTGVVKT